MPDITSAEQFDRQVQSTYDGLLKAAPKLNAAGVNTAPFKKELETSKASRDQLTKTIEDSVNAVKVATEQGNAGMDAGAKAVGDKATADQARAQEVADNEAFYNDLYGIGKNRDVGIAKDVLRETALREEALAQLDEIKGMQGTSLIDNPVDWLLNQMQLPGMINTYNATADQVGIIGSSINERIAQAKANAEQFNKSVPEITAAQAKAVADSALAKAQVDKAQADINMASKNVDFRNRKLSADLAVLEGQGKLTDFELKNSQAAYAAKVENIRLEQSQDQRNMQALNLQQSFRADKSTEELLRQYATLTGQKNVIPLERFKHMPPTQQAEIMGLAVTGSFGAQPTTALANFIKANPGKDMNPGTVVLMKTLNNTISDIEKETNIRDAKDEKSKAELINKRVAEEFQKKINSAARDGPANPFFEVSPQAMMQTGFLPPDHPLTLALKGYTDRNVQPTTQQVLSAIETTYPNDPAMQGLAASRYYAENVKMRNASYDLGLIGLNKKLPSSYAIPVGGTFGFNAYPVDLTRPEEATKYFLIKNSGVIPDMARAASAAGEMLKSTGKTISGAVGAAPAAALKATIGNPEFTRRTTDWRE